MDDRKAPAEGEVQEFGADELYMVLCVVALILTAVGLEEFGSLCLVPLGLGIGALYFRWTSVPQVWLLVLACMIAVQSENSTALLFRGRRVSASGVLATRNPASPINFLTCAAALVFTIAYCRRMVLLEGGFPKDAKAVSPAVPDGRHAALKPVRRDKPAGGMAELTPLLSAVPVCCAAAYFSWLVLARVPPPEEVQLSRLHGEWGLLILCWLVGVTGAAASVVTGYLDRARATPEENLLFLQDQLWRETRREQSRLNRWLVWARLRGQRRKEKA